MGFRPKFDIINKSSWVLRVNGAAKIRAFLETQGTVGVKIDLHTHFLPAQMPNWAQRLGTGGFVQVNPIGPEKALMQIDGQPFREIDSHCWDPQRRLEFCDAHGISAQVISTVPVMFSYWASPQAGENISRWLNDNIAEVPRNHPKRFIALGTLPMQDPERAVRELHRCVNELGMPGVQIGTHVGDWELDHPHVVEVLQAADELGAAVFVHPWDMPTGKRWNRFWRQWLVGMPMETTMAITSVLLGGVMEKLPTLRLGFAHGAGAFPGLFGRIAHGYRMRPDLCATDSSLEPSQWIGKIYTDGWVGDPRTLAWVVELFGADRVAWGTDYPFPLGEQEPGGLILGNAAFTDAQQQRLLAGTALEFLGLDAKDFV